MKGKSYEIDIIRVSPCDEGFLVMVKMEGLFEYRSQKVEYSLEKLNSTSNTDRPISNGIAQSEFLPAPLKVISGVGRGDLGDCSLGQRPVGVSC